MDIGEVVAASGLPPSTLHHYEQEGLITPTGRRGLRRQYGPDVVERLAVIAMARDAGFGLGEIATLVAPDGRPRLDRSALAAKADELDARIEALAAIRDDLRHAAACPEPSHLDCPSFRHLMDVALTRRRSSRAASRPRGERSRADS